MAQAAGREPEYEGLEALPPVLGRGLLYIVIGLCLSLLAWAALGQVELVVTAEGLVIPLGEAAKVQAGTAGVVSEILIKEGQAVGQGQALIRMEALEQGSLLVRARTDYANAQSLLTLLETELATYKKLVSDGVVSRLEYIAKQKDYETTSRRLEQLAAEIGVAEAGKARMTVTAPAAGVVAFLKVFSPGQVVSPSEVLARIIPSGAPLVMELRVANKDISKIRLGYACKHKLDAFSFSDFGALSGRIIDIPPDAETDPLLGRVYRVTADFDRAYYEAPSGRLPLRAGLTGKTEIVTEKKRLLRLFLDPFRKLGRGITAPS